MQRKTTPLDAGGTEGGTPRGLWLSLFALVCFNFALDGNLGGNELDKLLGAYAWAHPGFLDHDFYFGSPNQAHVIFSVLSFPLVKALPLLYASILGRVLCALWITHSLARIMGRLGLGVTGGTIAMAVYLWVPNVMMVNKFIFNSYQTKLVAYALVLFGLERLTAGRWTAGAFSLGLSASVHAMVGGWSSIAAGCAILLHRPLRGAASWIRAAAAWSLGALFFLVLSFRVLFEASPPGNVDPDWVMVHFRNAQNLFPGEFARPSRDMLLLPAVLFVLFRWKAFYPRDRESHFLRTVVLASFSFYLAGLAAFPFPFSTTLYKFHVFRVGAVFTSLFGVIFLVKWLSDRVPEVPRWAGALALAAVFLRSALLFQGDLQVAGHGIPALKREPRAEDRAYYQACSWIRENTPPETVVLAPPGKQTTILWSRRSVPVTYKLLPTMKSDVTAYYERLLDFNGGKPFSERGMRVPKEIDANFSALSDEEYRRLAGNYGARFALLPASSSTTFPASYRNALWGVYRIPGQ